MLSNLGATWPNQGIGDIGLVFSGQSFGMSFQTGNTPYGIDSITLEHFEYSALAAQDFDLQIFRIGNKLPGPNPNVWSVSLLGELGNPVIDPRPTQWPGSTTFVTYTPVTTFTLEPNTSYLVAAVRPTDGLGSVNLMFAPGAYVASDGWSEKGFPFNSQWANWGSGWTLRDPAYKLKLEVNATPVPEPGSSAVILLGLAVISRQRRGQRKKPRAIQIL